MKHFVLNLRKRPMRLGFWFGYQYAHGMKFGLHDITIVRAIDKDDFDTRADMARYAVSCGLEYWDTMLNSEKKSGGLSALRLTHDLTLKHIANTVDAKELCTIWVDDNTLAIPIGEYEIYVKDVFELGCHVLTMFKYPFDRNDPEIIGTYNKDCNQFLHESGIVYTRCVGGGFNNVFVVTPEGARKILELSKEYASVSLLHIMYHQREQTEGWLYTAVPNYTIDNHYFFESDIYLTERDHAYEDSILCFDEVENAIKRMDDSQSEKTDR